MKFTNSRRIQFYGVAMFIIMAGIGTFTTGFIQLLLSITTPWSSELIPELILGGLIILALGYIILELEMIRQK